MSKETILKIQQTESEANRIIEETEEKAKRLKSEADAAGRKLCEKTEADTCKELAAKLEQVRERTEEVNRRVIAEGEQEAATLSATVRDHRKLAEELILGRLEAKCR